MIVFTFWNIIAIPVALFITVLTMFMIREFFFPSDKAMKHTTLNREVDRYVDNNFLPITPAEVFRRCEHAKGSLDERLFIRVDK